MWLKLPGTTLAFSPATEASTSPSEQQLQALAASATWRGKPRQSRFWRRAWPTVGWMKRLSGLTCEPSQADSSVAAWVESLEGSPAKTSALPEDAPEYTATEADCFLRSVDSFASWNPSSGCFLKTCRQPSLFQQEQPYSESLPRSGSMRSGRLYERPMWADRTGESGRLCWPTAVVTDSNGARNETSGRSMASQHHSGTTLNDAVIKWPTPATRDYRSPNGASHMDRSTGAKHLDQLPNFIKHSFLPAPPTSTHGGKSPSGSTRRLNPDFVDWLMGLIPGWTDYAPLETESYLCKVRSLLRSCLGGHAE